ncbi:uncharacterized protein YbaP (TraB family) [Alkalihalobacillus xiaoxiensis]|uniref:Uncharacterized protein YbaP (TraB family) n=1 Tax=Shouchella xiaoxiensis TaxID=766895 RepID=A0ABS2SNT7_9BACI|nr:TraB/GumN family protein [Shouchella xiaoxiensis]MBM7837178.1 uncharacterized protein YbaP (TraB family) [Shouchella xiaoxiensis]
MTKKWHYAGLSLVLLAGLAACNNAEDETDGDAEPDNETTTGTDEVEEGNGGFLWKIEHEDTIAYLQGTIHVGREDFYPLNPQTEAAYEQADVVLPEVDIVNADETELAEMMTPSTLPDDETIADYISADHYAELEEILSANGIPMEMFESFEPWFLENLLLAIGIQSSDLQDTHGVEEYFLSRAVEDGKEIRELETIEGQFEMMSGFSIDTQVQLLESAIDTFEEAADELDAMGESWLEGDIEAMEAIWQELLDSDVDEEYTYELNDARNLDMSETIDEILQENSGQTYFVFVGSMHLVAEPSIVSILEEKGYTVDFIY